MCLLWRRWCTLLVEREPGTAIALFRISIGACVLWLIGSIAANGLVTVVWLNPEDGGWRIVRTPWLLKWLGGVHPNTVWMLVAVALGSAFCLMIGLFGRIAAFLALQSVMALTHIDRPGFDDLLLGNLLWLLVLARNSATLSVDCRLRTGSWRSSEPIPAWPRFLVLFQLVVLYCASGLQKASIYWTPADGFSALYYILQSPRWARADKPWLADIYPLTQFATAITWIWEVTAPLLLVVLWLRRNKVRRINLLKGAFVAIGVAVHLGIFALMDLGPFSFIVLSCYLCLFRFGPPAEAPPPRGGFVVPLFVLFHITAVLLQAIPAPMYKDRRDWKHPGIQVELANWANRLHVPPEELEETLWRISDCWLRIRDPIQQQIAPYYRFCGTSQGWRMFVAPDLEPTRLEIDVLENGEWRCVYRELDSEHRWQAGVLEHWRFRVAFFSTTWSRNWTEFHGFAEWLRPRGAADFPEAGKMRVRLFQWRLLPADEMRAGKKPDMSLAQSEEFKLKGASDP